MVFKYDISAGFTNKLFNNAEKSLKFIADAKWEDGFVCQKCGNTNYCEGKAPSSRRCTRCKTEESVTAHTLFHNIRFSINKAFYIAYNVCVEGKEFSSYDYSDKMELNQMNCWKFRKQIKDCVMKYSAYKGKNAIQTILLSEY